MGQYEVTPALLKEAADVIRLIADGLGAVRDQLGGALSGLNESMPDARRQMAISCEAAGDLRLSAERLEQTLREATEAYTRAEMSASDYLSETGQDAKAGRQPAAQAARLPAVVRKNYGVLLSSDLVMPDWLQAAVLKYEQMNGAPTGT